MVRRLVITRLEGVGLAEPARRLRSLVDPVSRRNRLDDERVRLLLAFLLRDDSNCIDVGANTGEIVALFARYGPRGRHIAYEPIPHLAQALRTRFPAVDVRQRAVGNTAGSTSFTYVRSNPAYSGFLPRTYPRSEEIETIVVETETLDEGLPEGYVPSLVKIDVEGAEQQVLEGAVRTLARHQPVVVFEHGHGGAAHYGTSPLDIFALLCGEARLRIFDLDGNGPMSASQFEESAAPGSRRWNFVAHP